MVAAEAAGIPFLVLMPNIYLLPDRGHAAARHGPRPAKGVARSARDRVIGGVHARCGTRRPAPLNALAADLGLEPVAHFWDQVHRAGVSSS